MKNLKGKIVLFGMFFTLLTFYTFAADKWVVNSESGSPSVESSWYFRLQSEPPTPEPIYKLKGAVIVPEDMGIESIIKEVKFESEKELEKPAPEQEDVNLDTKEAVEIKTADEKIKHQKKLAYEDDYEQTLDLAYVAQLSTLGDHMQDAVSESLNFDIDAQMKSWGRLSIAKSVDADALHIMMMSDTGLSFTTISFLVEKGYIGMMDYASDVLGDRALEESLLAAAREAKSTKAEFDDKGKKDEPTSTTESKWDPYREEAEKYIPERDIKEDTPEPSIQDTPEDDDKQGTGFWQETEYLTSAPDSNSPEHKLGSDYVAKLGVLDDQVEDKATTLLEEPISLLQKTDTSLTEPISSKEQKQGEAENLIKEKLKAKLTQKWAEGMANRLAIIERAKERVTERLESIEQNAPTPSTTQPPAPPVNNQGGTPNNANNRNNGNN